ncbi:MAG: hypothetical protein IKD27_00095 [Oscillospiraceae bacterium]|nr:hypothetical protein [Oscillospiraceae bacterium]
MKKTTLVLTLVLVIALLAGCAGTPVIYYTDCTCPTGGHAAPVESTPVETDPVETTEPSVTAEGAVKTGVAIIASAAESTSAEDADGEAKYDVSVVAVTVDDSGVIQSCVIDSIGTSVKFDVNGAIVSDLTAPIQTKNELGDAYNMKLYGGAVAEWYEQAAALASYAEGKTVEELRAGAVDETGHAADADLATTATIYLGGYVAAIEKAVANAQYLGAEAGDELKLAIISSVDGSKAADAENAGLCELYTSVAAVTLRDGVITSCMIDAVQAKVNFDTVGTVTTDLTAPIQTKNELGENYGMVAWGGAIAEWNEQAASFAAYITGKTPAEVASIAVDETTKPTDADLSTSVTIKIGGFQALIAKACN